MVTSGRSTRNTLRGEASIVDFAPEQQSTQMITPWQLVPPVVYRTSKVPNVLHFVTPPESPTVGGGVVALFCFEIQISLLVRVTCFAFFFGSGYITKGFADRNHGGGRAPARDSSSAQHWIDGSVFLLVAGAS